MSKADFLQECMSEFKNAPIDAFNREFCTLCSNRECSRSWGNTSIFDARAKNWREVLFTNVPRSNDTSAANQKFEPVGWVPEITSAPTPITAPLFETLSYDDVPDTDPIMAPNPSDPTPNPSDPTPNPSDPTPNPRVAKPVQAVNTTFDQPAMLGGSNKTAEEKTESPGCVFVFEDE